MSAAAPPAASPAAPPIGRRSDAFYRLRREVFDDEDDAQIDAGSVEGRPRMTEPWFC